MSSREHDLRAEIGNLDISGCEQESEAERLRSLFSAVSSCREFASSADFEPLRHLPSREELLSQHAIIDTRVSALQEVAPSRFWRTHLERHVQMLANSGLENFKRTVGHHYISFMSLDIHFDQVQSALRLWRLHNSKRVLRTHSVRPSASSGFLYEGEDLYRLSKSEYWDAYVLMTALLFEYALLDDHLQLLSKIRESRIGNPLEIFIPVSSCDVGESPSYQLISQDLSHISRELNYMNRHGVNVTGKRVLEIGAGYGRLCEPVLSLGASQFVIVDISPALIVSQFYITNTLSEEFRVFKFREFSHWSDVEEEFLSSHVAFLSADQIRFLPDKYFDLSINILSIMEMTRISQRFYLRELHRLTSGFFYSKQYTLQQNPYDVISTTREDYIFPEEWESVDRRTDPAYSRIYQELFVIP